MKLRTSTCWVWLALVSCGAGEETPSAPARLVELTAGDAHTCGRDDTGAIWCWGEGTSGQLGDGGRASRGSPALVPHDLAWSAVSAGGAHTCGLNASGEVWCWGAGASGQLGGARRIARAAPAKVSLPGEAARVSAGRDSTCAALESGGVWCWGDGTSIPSEIAGVDASLGLASGAGGGCALSALSALTCWGSLGVGGEVTEIVTPTTWRSLEARGARACGLDEADALWCVGRGAPGFGTWSGDLGQPWEAHQGPLSQLTLGRDAWCARERDVTVCAGASGSGQLGAGLALEPEAVRLGSKDWEDVALGASHGCGIERGEATCWGSTRDGRLGDGRGALALAPAHVPLDEETRALATSDLQTCALSIAGTVRCWGGSSIGSSIDASTRVEATPRVLAAPGAMTELALGSGHVATLDATGEAYHAEPSAPGLVRLGVPEPLVSLSSSALGACALNLAGRPSCWGPTGRGITPTPLSQQVEPAFDALSLGPDFQCGIASETAALWCWGANLRGQLGVGDRIPRTQPSIAWTDRVRDVSTSLTHACAVTERGDLLCWGDNSRGQLPLTARETPHPSKAPGEGWVSVSVGFSHGCALDEAGVAWCWGGNTSGALGDGTTTRRRAPTPVATSRRFTQIVVGAMHTCALDEDAEVWCWGAGDLGQLGLERYAGAPAP